jgi:carbamate kinase
MCIEKGIEKGGAMVTMTKKILVALGGNAILKHKEKGTAEEQFENVAATARHLAELVKNGYRIAITHGNGPQVGDILLANECAKDMLPPMPLDVCGAESGGMIGYMLQQSMQNELSRMGIHVPVVTILTQTLVDKDDPAFQAPAKPIGPFFTALEASQIRKERGWTIANDSGRGYRRLVPSPNPQTILESDATRALFSAGVVVIACGGGGIPVIRDDEGNLCGVEAVIDKDHTAALLARALGAEILLILTDVGKVALNFGRSSQQDLDLMTVSEAVRFRDEGQFAKGSMEPKIEAAIDFLGSGGERVVITRPELGYAAIERKAGTHIVPDWTD